MWGVVLKTGLHNLSQMIGTLSVHSFGCFLRFSPSCKCSRCLNKGELTKQAGKPSAGTERAWVLSAAGVRGAGLKVSSFLVCNPGPEEGLKSFLNRPCRRTSPWNLWCCGEERPPSSAALPLVDWNMGTRGSGRVSQALQLKTFLFPTEEAQILPRVCC